MNIAFVQEIEKEKVMETLGMLEEDYVNGMILVKVPYLGLNYYPCRYGLGVPNLSVEKGSLVLTEFVEGDKGIMFYIGLCDKGGYNESVFTEYLVKAKKLEIYMNDLVAKFNKLLEAYNNHTHEISDAVTAVSGGTGPTTPAFGAKVAFDSAVPDMTISDGTYPVFDKMIISTEQKIQDEKDGDEARRRREELTNEGGEG